METKELEINKKVSGEEKLRDIFTSLTNAEGKKLVEAVKAAVNWFDLHYNDNNRWEVSKQVKINDTVCFYYVLRNCEDLFNYRQFDPEASLIIETKYFGDIRAYGSGVEGGCTDEELYLFYDMIRYVYKEVKKSRSFFRKRSKNDDI